MSQGAHSQAGPQAPFVETALDLAAPSADPVRHPMPHIILALLVLLAACGNGQAPTRSGEAPAAAEAGKVAVKGAPPPIFPPPDRPVAEISSGAWSDEDSRDDSGEAARVFTLLGLAPGQTVADIGAGSGYYTVRLSPLLGAQGLVIANDVMPDYLARLKRRVAEMGLGNVRFILGDPGNALLPPASTDVALMVHMYHEIGDPFSLTWHLHDSLRPGGRVAIIDSDRPTSRHGTPPALLKCEMAATGFRQTDFHRLGSGSYLAVFTPETRPDPRLIRACKAG